MRKHNRQVWFYNSLIYSEKRIMNNESNLVKMLASKSSLNNPKEASPVKTVKSNIFKPQIPCLVTEYTLK